MKISVVDYIAYAFNNLVLTNQSIPTFELRYKLLILSFIFSILVLTATATTYTSIAVGTWDANGAPPNPLPSGDIVNVNHAGMFFDWPNTVTLQDGSALNVNSGGVIQILNLIVDANASLQVASGGLLQTVGSITNNSNNFVINGAITDNSSFVNNGSITGTGTLNVSGAASGSGTINGVPTGDIDFSSQVDLGGPLPVTLLYFGVSPVDKVVKLEWATATELNNDFFTIERSEDGSRWKVLAEIDGNGNSSNVIFYSWMDYFPHTGISYYRLKQTDFDGSYEYFDTKVVDIGEGSLNTDLLIYPNPATDIVSLAFSGDKPHSFRISDMTGKDVTDQLVFKQTNNRTITAEIGALKAGHYIINAGDFVRRIEKR